MTYIAPIQTVYKGYRFRSRLEARWAVFFDAMGWVWEYESDGYVVFGERYLPDFWLPEFKTFIEIKPETYSEREMLLCRGLAELTQTSVILVHGLPRDDIAYPLYHNTGTGDDVSLCRFRDTVDGYWFIGIVENPEFTEAVNAARAARFEYGENGAPKRRATLSEMRRALRVFEMPQGLPNIRLNFAPLPSDRKIK